MSPSRTHFIEVVRIERGDPQELPCPCGVVPGGASYLITGDTTKTEPTWFKNKSTLRRGDWTVKYLGGVRTISNYCYGCGDFDWDSGNQKEPVDNLVYVSGWNNWAVYDHRVPTDGQGLPGYSGDYGTPGLWEVLNTKQVRQKNNGSPTFFLSPDTHIDKELAVNWVVGTQFQDPPDDDFVGIVFGATINQSNNKPSSYYVLCWKKGSQRQRGYNAEAGIRLLKLVNVDGLTTYQVGDRIWDGSNWSSGTSSVTVLAESLGPAWNHNTHYQYNVVYRATGEISVRVSRILNPGVNLETRQYEVVWEESVVDATPLSAGKYGCFSFSQPDVTFESHVFNRIYFMTTSPEGDVCTSGAQNIEFNGTSDDIAILIHADDEVIEEYSGFSGDPVTFTLPQNHIIFRDTVGHMLNKPYVGRPGTVPKTFQTPGSEGITYSYPRGTSSNSGSGHAVDLENGGFETISWGDQIPVTQLAENGWLDSKLRFRFKLVHVPSGLGHLNVQSVSCDGVLVDPGNVETDPVWKIVTQTGNTEEVIEVIDDAPIVVNDSVSFNLSASGPIGIRFDSTPSSLTLPKFLLTSLGGTIQSPKQIEFIQQNETLRPRGFEYTILIGDETYSSGDPEHIYYFSADDKMYPPDGLRVPPRSEVRIKFIVPIDTEETTATVEIAEGSATTVGEADLVPRIHLIWPLNVHRDLLPSLERQFTAKTAAFRFNIKYVNYNPYLYSGGNLSLITWDTILNNREVFVAIEKDTPIESALAHLRTHRGVF